jgi:FtsH-binding integral membrane protein
VTTFDLSGAPAPKTASQWLLPVCGLVIAAVLAAIVCPLPPVHTLSFGEIVYASLKSVVAVFFANALAVWGIGAFRPEISKRVLRRLVLRTSIEALWLAPLVLFIQEKSIWALAMGAVLVSGTVRSIYYLQPRDRGDDGSEPLEPLAGPLKFGLTESRTWIRRQMYSAGAALCAQIAVMLGFAEYQLAAVTLVGFSSAAWTWSYMADNEGRAPRLSVPPKSSSQIVAALALAMFFTVGGLMRYMTSNYGSGGLGLASRFHWTHRVPDGDRREVQIVERGKYGHHYGIRADEKTSESARSAATDPEETPQGSVISAKNENSGIILLPKKEASTKLVAPAPASGNGLLKNGRRANPLVIPFNGVYWFFKAPDVRPPEKAREMHGSPELLDIHSTDRRPLSMEAHEHLGSLLSLDCCSRIQIEIRNTDVYQETVSLELILTDSSVPGHPSESLGTMVVKSKRAWKLYEKASPVSETLTFPIPSKPSIRRFDEVKIVFRLDAFRADDGAKVAIDHFVLVPRGL